LESEDFYNINRRYYIIALVLSILSSCLVAVPYFLLRSFVGEGEEGYAPHVFAFNMMVFFPSILGSSLVDVFAINYLLKSSSLEAPLPRKVKRIRNIFPFIFYYHHF